MELDTNSDLFPEGTYKFRIVDVPEQGTTPSGYLFFKFLFIGEVDGEQKPYQERFMRWLMGPLCHALGFTEIKPGKFDFELTDCLNREVFATIKHEKIEKGASAGQIVARMKDIKPADDAKGVPLHRAAMAAQAPLEADIPF